jgi:hypothetical protein
MHRETVLEVVANNPVTREPVVAGGWGPRTRWLHNVEAGLAHGVRTGRRRFAPAYRILPPDEAERTFADQRWTRTREGLWRARQVLGAR